MRSFLLLSLTVILICQPSLCQTKAKITDVDFNIEDRYIVVSYNLTGTLPKEQMTIELQFINDKNETIMPKSVTGDVGTKLFPDGQKTILWDLVADQLVLSGNFKATVAITSSKILYSGASNAFLSILIPGLGGYFVDKHKGRAVLTTVGTVGLMAYGLSQKIKSNNLYDDYNSASLPADIQTKYEAANDAHHKYLTATRVGAGLWALDVIWVAFKGAHNKKVAKAAYSTSIYDGLRINYVNNGWQMKYSVTF